MCGIAGGFEPVSVGPALSAMAHRGPDAWGTWSSGTVAFGHDRLAIVDLDPRSNQPYRYGKTTISFNGEIWNWREVRTELENFGRRFRTSGDTEVLAAALDEWGASALTFLNGMFAVAWTSDGVTVNVARDRFGEIPLHYAAEPFRFASEKKALLAMGCSPEAILDVGPGEVIEAKRRGGLTVNRWYAPPCFPAKIELDEAAVRLRALIDDGAADRAMSDVPVCTLLSGGIDSAAIAACLRTHVRDLTAYVAVMDEKSRDVRCARLAADYLEIDLAEVRIPEPTQADLARVVAVIEMPYKAQVEIGWPCLKLAEAMHSDGFKVTYSGEGSDELWASYGFSYHGLKTAGWHEYRRDLFLTQARKNFPRANKAFMAHSVECRLPFLHPSTVEFALSLPRSAVERDGRQKAVMSAAFNGMLPEEILRRPKVAFQDGLGVKKRIAASMDSPERFYREEYRKTYGAAETINMDFGA